ncbi:glycosyltransferase [Luteococcus sp. H91]|uniref:glycosyltransferase n=1 Tax=Luteococcus sp. H91 TaxID=3139401 RepID=UPI00313AE31D
MAAISYGTEGDVRPLVALGEALRAAGHDFLLAGDAGSQPLARAHDVRYVPLAGGLRQRLGGRDEMADFIRSGDSTLSGLGVLRRLLAQHLHGWTTDLLAAAGEADVVLSSGLSLPAGFNAAEALGVPAVAVFFQPFEPGDGRRSAMLPHGIPDVLQRPLFRAGNLAGWYAVRDLLNGSRRQLGLPVRVLPWQDYQQLGAWSPSLLPGPVETCDGPGLCVTGDWPLAPPVGFRPDPALADFLAAGEPPIYVGFGSMSLPPGLLPTLLTGLAGRRVLLASGWAGEVPERLSADLHVVEHVPHAWLLPRVAAAVHHCGAGTTHAMVRAGVPSIPVPITVDQPYWARQLFRLGLGTRPLDPRRLRPEDVAVAVGQVDSLLPRVRQVSIRLGTEDGPATAITRLRQIAG